MVRVYVWNYSRRAVITKTGNVGHAAMQIGPEYISWWPATDGSRYLSTPTDDEAAEGKAADHVIDVFGLDEPTMMNWWQGFKNGNRYELISMNCSTVVGRALLAGGAARKSRTMWGRYWDSWNIIWDPDDVRRLAESVGRVRR